MMPAVTNRDTKELNNLFLPTKMKTPLTMVVLNQSNELNNGLKKGKYKHK